MKDLAMVMKPVPLQVTTSLERSQKKKFPSRRYVPCLAQEPEKDASAQVGLVEEVASNGILDSTPLGAAAETIISIIAGPVAGPVINGLRHGAQAFRKSRR